MARFAVSPVSSKRAAISGWLVVALVGLAPGILLDPALVARTIVPLKGDSLEVPQSFDLGDFKPRETQTVSLQIRNLGWRRIELRPIDSDCGCLVVNDAPRVLSAGQSSIIKASIEAPSVPGEFARSLLIRPIDDEGLVWRVAVQGRVAAKVWSEPAELELELGPSMMAEARLRIQHTDDVQLGRLVPTLPSIQIVGSRKLESGIELQIRVTKELENQQAEKEGALQIFAEGNSTHPILLIPIRARRFPQVGYVPQKLEFPRFGGEPAVGDRIRRVVAVVVPPDRSAHELKRTVLVPWMSIEAEKSEGSILRLELEFDRREMPDEFHEAVLSTRLPDQQVNQQFIAVGYRVSK